MGRVSLAGSVLTRLPTFGLEHGRGSSGDCWGWGRWTGEVEMSNSPVWPLEGRHHASRPRTACILRAQGSRAPLGRHGRPRREPKALGGWAWKNEQKLAARILSRSKGWDPKVFSPKFVTLESTTPNFLTTILSNLKSLCSI